MKNPTQKKSIYFIFSTIVLDMVGIGLIIPVLPDVIRRFSSDASYVTQMFGYFVAVYAFIQFLASPVLGSLSDRFGRRPVLLTSLLGASIDYVFMALAPTLPLLFVGRIISGLTGASMTVANSYIADISDDSNRSANFGMIGAAFGIGFIGGPLIGGALSHMGPSAPFLAAAGLNFLNFLFGFFILPESLPIENRRNLELSKLNPFVTVRKLLTNKAILLFVIGYFLLILAGSVHPSIWTLYTERKFGWTSWQVGMSLSFVGLVFGIGQGVFTKKLVPKWGEINSLKVGMVFYFVGYIFYGLVSEGWMIYLVILFSSLSGLAMPCLQSLMTKQIPANQQGELQGGLVSLSSIASVCAPLLYATTFNWAISNSESKSIYGLPYYIAALTVLICWSLVAKKVTEVK